MKLIVVAVAFILILRDIDTYVVDGVVDSSALAKLHVELLHRQRNDSNNAYYAYDESDLSLDPDVKGNTSELISSKGYIVEEHTVQTSDGYLLGVQRIPKGKNDNSSAERPAILLLHGLLSSSSQFVLNYPNQSAAFLLADAGYDVWLGNFRGNVYSKRHVKYNPRQSAFWNFSWDDMALIDLPASIDYIRTVTGQDKIFYGGHSMGTTAIFALLSDSEEYNNKLKAVIALAPVANLTHSISPMNFLSPYAEDFGIITAFFGEDEFFPTDELIGMLGDLVCGPKTPKFICHNVAFLFLGTDLHMNESRVDVYMNHFPAGTSSRTIIHYAQCYRDKKFQKYDYGKAGNMERYGQEHPPIYDVSKITTPVGLYSSDSDSTADPIDVADLEAQLTNVLEWYKVPCDRWSHVDYSISTDGYDCVFKKVIETLNSLK